MFIRSWFDWLTTSVATESVRPLLSQGQAHHERDVYQLSFTLHTVDNAPGLFPRGFTLLVNIVKLEYIKLQRSITSQEVRLVIKRVSAAKAKARLAAIASEVADGGPHVVIERRSKPWVALVMVSDLEFLEQAQPTSERPLGALALAGAWREVDDEAMEALVEEIYAERDYDLGRPVNLGI